MTFITKRILVPVLCLLTFGLAGQSIEEIHYYFKSSKVNDYLLRGDDLLLATDVGIFVLDPASGELREHWTIATAGLPSNRVESLALSPTTNSLYIGTYDIGAALQTTDGDWETMPFPEALIMPFHQFRTFTIAFDQSGTLWAGTSQGLWKKEDTTEWEFINNQQFNNLVNGVWDIVEDDSGDLLFGSNVVFKESETGFEIITPMENGSPEVFSYSDSDLFLSSNGDVWVFTDIGEYALWRDGEWTSFIPSSSPELPLLFSGDFIFEDDQGKLWKKRQYVDYNVYDGENWSSSPTTPFGFEEPENVIGVNGQWFGFKDASLFRLSTNDEPQMSASLEDWPWSNEPWGFENDLSGNLWSKMREYELLNFTTNETFEAPQATVDYYISDYIFGPDHTIWVNNGSNIYQSDLSGNILQTFSSDNGDFPSTYIRDLVIDGSGAVWMRNGDGQFLQLQGDAWEQVVSFSVTTNTYSFLPGENNNAYVFTIRTGHGVEMAELQADNVIYHDLPPGWSANFFWAFPGEEAGDVWIFNMQAHKLALWDGDEWNIMPFVEEWDADKIPALFRVVEGKIWVAGPNQMAFWDGNDWTYYDHLDLLWDTERITDGGIDNQGNIWLRHGNNIEAITYLQANWLSTSLEDVSPEQLQLKTWPNPGTTFMAGNWTAGAVMTAWTMDGRLMAQQNIKTAGEIIDCSAWPFGAYFISVSSDKKTQTGIFIKE